MGFHLGFSGVFPLVDFCWADCPCLPSGLDRLPVDAWADIGADGLYGEREEFEGVAFEGRAREVVDFGRQWAPDVDVEGSADLGRVILRAPGEDEDVDGNFELRRVAEEETIAARPRVAVKERGTLGTREDEATSVATSDTVGIFGGVYSSELG
jgi:hypothetical protein